MHYYKRNIGDYAKKAGRLTMLQHGAYTLLLDACYDREQFPTRSEAIDWLWASSTAEIEAVDFVLSKFFTLEDDRYVQNRIKDELAEYHEKSRNNRRIAQEREAKRRENSTKRAHIVNEPPPNQEPLTINQEPITIEDTRAEALPTLETKEKRSIVEKPESVTDGTWKDWLALRRSKKAPVTKTVIEMAKRESAKANMTLENFLQVWCARGSQGLQADWLTGSDRVNIGRRMPQSENFENKNYGTGVRLL